MSISFESSKDDYTVLSYSGTVATTKEKICGFVSEQIPVSDSGWIDAHQISESEIRRAANAQKLQRALATELGHKYAVASGYKQKAPCLLVLAPEIPSEFVRSYCVDDITVPVYYFPLSEVPLVDRIKILQGQYGLAFIAYPAVTSEGPFASSFGRLDPNDHRYSGDQTPESVGVIYDPLPSDLPLRILEIATGSLCLPETTSEDNNPW